MRHITLKDESWSSISTRKVKTINMVSSSSFKDIMPTQEQLEAINHLIKHINSDKTSVSLIGSAGTGKTYCVKALLKHLKHHSNEFKVILAAPTHKAKLVLSNMIPEGIFFDESQITTIHSLLGLKPNMSIVDFDARDMKFIGKMSPPLFSQIPIYIVDESSMINDLLYDKLVKEVKDLEGILIFLGDEKQLAPVGEYRSKVFDKTDTQAFILNNIIRQKDENPMTPILATLREEPIFQFETNVNQHGGIIVHDNPNSFLTTIKNKYTDPPIYKNPIKYKVLCYTNRRVAQFNLAIRKQLGYNDILVKGELLMGYDNYISSNGVNKIFNSNDYVLINKERTMLDIPFYGLVNGYTLKLSDTVDGSKFLVNLIDPELSETVYSEIGVLLESFRMAALNSKYYKAKSQNWSNFYKLKDFFVSFKDISFEGRVIKKATLNYGYAISVHKSQGSTYEEVFIDMQDILRCPNRSEIRSLQYVAVSRAKQITHVLQ